MTILDIAEINRKENFIYYRREFTAKAVYELPGRKTTGQIEFTIETAATGKKDVHIVLVDTIDYPVVPVMKGLKEFILLLDSEGKLP